VNESDENKRFSFLDKLAQQIEKTNKLYEDDKLRIFPKLQKELWEEGYNEEEGQYVGSKWGKYIRATDIFFKILEKGKNILVPLKEIAEIRRGHIPWPYEFYILDNNKIKQFRIESQFLKLVFRSPDESDTILLNRANFNKFLLLVSKPKKDLKNTNVLKYINWGEKQNYKREKREDWYILDERKPAKIIWIRTPYNRHICFLNNLNLQVVDHVEISLQNEKLYCAILNSTLYALFREFFGRSTLGLGTLKIEAMDVKQLPIIKYSKISESQKNRILKIFNTLSKRPIGTIFEEIGANSPEEVSLDKVKPDRRELDKIIMNEILGLTEEEQLEVYRAVVKLVKERIERAKSVEKRKKEKGADPEALAEGILREVNINKLKKFPDEYIGNYEYEVRKVPEGEPELGSDLKGFFVKVDDKRINCDSSEEAQWIYYAILNGITSVKIPKNKKVMKDILKEYSNTYKKIQNEIKVKLESYILDRKLREKVQIIINKKVLK
jgi:hypothetical protein